MLLRRISCSRAAQTIADEIGGNERQRAANRDWLYRNHLKNGKLYRDFVKTLELEIEWRYREFEEASGDPDRYCKLQEHKLQIAKEKLADAEAFRSANILKKAIDELQLSALRFAVAWCDAQGGNQTVAAIHQSIDAWEEAENQVWNALRGIVESPVKAHL
jgi:hypothetical protein